MDPMALAGMIFTLILVALIGGIIVFTPLVRRLAALLELRLQERMQPGQIGARDAAELKKLVAALEEEVHALRAQHASLEERQRFLEALLRSDEQARLLPGEHADLLPAESERRPITP